MTAVLTFEGYELYERVKGGWRSVIDGENVNFDSVAQWVNYIKKIKYGKNS